MKVDNDIISESREVCELMAKHYSKVISSESYSDEFNRQMQNIEQDYDFESQLVEDYNAPIMMTEMKTILNNVKDAAPGEDLISYSMIKNLHDTALCELHKIIQKIWTNGEFIDSWRKSVILSFLKAGKDQREPLADQFHSPLPYANLMEKIVNVRLMRTLNRKDYLFEHQFGYRQGKSTTDNLVMLHNDVMAAFSGKEQLVAIFFDLEKAFNITWRHGILKIIHEQNIRGPMAKFIQNYLERRRFVCSIGTQTSTEHYLE